MATRLLFWKKEEEEAASDEAHAQPGILSDFILGSQDGLVNVLGVILGVAVGAQALSTDPIRIILAGGFAATFAESISMGAVAYTSTVARRDHYIAEVERERQEMVELPDRERDEVREILARWDFHGQELEDMLERIVAKPKAWLELMMAHELNLAPVDKGAAEERAPRRDRRDRRISRAPAAVPLCGERHDLLRDPRLPHRERGDPVRHRMVQGAVDRRPPVEERAPDGADRDRERPRGVRDRLPRERRRGRVSLGSTEGARGHAWGGNRTRIMSLASSCHNR